VSDPRRRLGQVLAGQPFPAARWELIVGADLYGADALTMSKLHALPAVRLGSLADVLKAVERARHDALDGERGRRSAKAEGWSTTHLRHCRPGERDRHHAASAARG
jgi:hypothetical protein